MLAFLHRFAAATGAFVTLATANGRIERPPERGRPDEVPIVLANDNRVPAGQLKDGTLNVNLVVRMARWFPEQDGGPSVDVAAFAERGKAPTIPGPLIRVPAGTTIVATVDNEMSDSTIWVRGLVTRPSAPDSTPIAPGTRHTFRFVAGAPGTYLYGAAPGRVDYDNHEREQLSSAFVVDPPGAHVDDRIFVINIWGDAVDSTHYRNALSINGKSWPYTERISANVGDSLRWRILNGSARVHPMHLHGFYFRVDSRGSYLADTIYSAERRRLAVTEDMAPASTMAFVFSPDRPGNWLFHCHLTFHVNADARLDGSGAEHVHEGNPMKHMAGLVLGIIVNPRAGQAAAPPPPGEIRQLHLFADERPHPGRAPLEMSYVLQRDANVPKPDSVEQAGAVIVLHRNEPTSVTIVNRTHEGTAVHWHGIELESYSDGVAGWSGAGKTVAPMIAPRDSFVANLTLPRAGTFIYHTHLNDIEQVTSGMYGAVIVLDKGETYDPVTDHAFVVGWDGPKDPPKIVVNGDSLPPPLELRMGRTHRLRFVNIGPAGRMLFTMSRDSIPVTWKPRAKDGADLPPIWRVSGPSTVRINVGETFDAEFDPPSPGEYQLIVGPPKTKPMWVQRVIVR